MFRLWRLPEGSVYRYVQMPIINYSLQVCDPHGRRAFLVWNIT